MESIKGFSLVNWIFVILGLICAFICPAFIQPWSTLTPAGVTIFLCICWYIVDGNRQ